MHEIIQRPIQLDAFEEHRRAREKAGQKRAAREHEGACPVCGGTDRFHPPINDDPISLGRYAEVSSPLYDSRRDYVAQVDEFRRHQGRAAARKRKGAA